MEKKRGKVGQSGAKWGGEIRRIDEFCIADRYRAEQIKKKKRKKRLKLGTLVKGFILSASRSSLWQYCKNEFVEFYQTFKRKEKKIE